MDPYDLAKSDKGKYRGGTRNKTVRRNPEQFKPYTNVDKFCSKTLGFGGFGKAISICDVSHLPTLKEPNINCNYTLRSGIVYFKNNGSGSYLARTNWKIFNIKHMDKTNAPISLQKGRSSGYHARNNKKYNKKL